MERGFTERQVINICASLRDCFPTHNSRVYSEKQTPNQTGEFTQELSVVSEERQSPKCD